MSILQYTVMDKLIAANWHSTSDITNID